MTLLPGFGSLLFWVASSSTDMTIYDALLCHIRLMSLRDLLFLRGVKREVNLRASRNDGGQEKGRRNFSWDAICERIKNKNKELIT